MSSLTLHAQGIASFLSMNTACSCFGSCIWYISAAVHMNALRVGWGAEAGFPKGSPVKLYWTSFHIALPHRSGHVVCYTGGGQILNCFIPICSIDSFFSLQKQTKSNTKTTKIQRWPNFHQGRPGTGKWLPCFAVWEARGRHTQGLDLSCSLCFQLPLSRA